jgi:hypothetical protein
MASEDEILELRQLVAEADDSSGFEDEYLSLIIDATESMNAAASKVWSIKAGRYASLVDVTESGSSRKLGDLRKNAAEMAAYYGDLDVPAAQVAELAAQRMLTRYFIEADELVLTLYRSTTTDDGAGGVLTGTPAPIAPQCLRLITQGSTGADSKQRFTANGQQVTPEYVLMGTECADIQRWDTFTLDGRTYEVVFVNQNQQYEVKAEVAYRV